MSQPVPACWITSLLCRESDSGNAKTSPHLTFRMQFYDMDKQMNTNTDSNVAWVNKVRAGSLLLRQPAKSKTGSENIRKLAELVPCIPQFQSDQEK